jgi:hypothetical protein
MTRCDNKIATPAPFGLPVLTQPVPLSPAAMRLITRGVRTLWQRIAAATPDIERSRPLLLSYDVHPTPEGPVLIEVNTNAGGMLTALEANRNTNLCCADWEHGVLQERLIELFRRDLLGPPPQVVAIVDDDIAAQALYPEMQAIAELLRPHVASVHLIDAAQLRYESGRLRYQGEPIDCVYWRSTDFLISEERHAAVRRAMEEGSTRVAPSPAAYAAIADKRRFLEWSQDPVLAHDERSGMDFRIAETLPMASRTAEAWYADRASWVFKPASGHASRGVYVGKSISRLKLSELPADAYLAQRYAPHPVVDREGRVWKYDVRFFADRDEIIGAVARVFHGQVVGMRTPGSGFAPVSVGQTCCLLGALAEAGSEVTLP